MELDNIDRRILRLLQRDNRLTNVALAELIGLSPPACLKRVKLLRQQGVIDREVAILNPKLAGLAITMIVEVEMERDRPDLYQRFSREIQQAPEVTQSYQVTGEVDFVLIVSVDSMESFQQFVERVLYAEPNIRKFRTLISMKRDKFTTELPL
ncbi:Lrp/AsnC family transcriptional regulator [Marinobacterium arenosum]|uniref:Lrp/AsnC family transcriptional regulator n=1 Tax=Marinobacterium arenosum TaxID=2862496 RepID=UPI001C98365F|nr:Lrp/AsnC family transcriptional regulator [Marinobacterium arenosum]MBY4678437.1 Lrp/AsnC family transcriptional regulator [Marinobacterium arenosum]